MSTFGAWEEQISASAGPMWSYVFFSLPSPKSFFGWQGFLDHLTSLFTTEIFVPRVETAHPSPLSIPTPQLAPSWALTCLSPRKVAEHFRQERRGLYLYSPFPLCFVESFFSPPRLACVVPASPVSSLFNVRERLSQLLDLP